MSQLRPDLAVIARHVAPGSRVLDVGCGTGELLEHLQERGAQPSGVDPASRMVELAQRLVPVAGRVTMDMTMVEVSDGAVTVGDVATVYGGIISLDSQARASGTISYELLTAIGARVPRRYSGAP